MVLDGLQGLSRLMKKASLAGAFFVSAIWLGAAQAQCPLPQGLASAQVRQVVDGDTVRLDDGRSVRLIGINAPEIGRKGRTSEPYAEAARQRLQALVAQSDGRVRVALGQEPRDRYGRTLAHLYGANDRNLEEQLLAEGLGYQVAIAPNVSLVDCLQAAEDRARQARLGVWRQSPVVSASQLRQSGFALVSGRVAKVQRNGGGLWIDVEGGLVLRIAPNSLSRFDSAALSKLPGQQIEVRGWVLDRSRRGGLQAGQARWLLNLTDPGMFKQLPD